MAIKQKAKDEKHTWLIGLLFGVLLERKPTSCELRANELLVESCESMSCESTTLRFANCEPTRFRVYKLTICVAEST